MSKSLLIVALIAFASACAAGGGSEGAPHAVPRVIPERMRGFNGGDLDNFTPADVERIAVMGANVLRWNVRADAGGAQTGTRPTETDPLAAYADFISLLDALLPTLRAHDVKLIVSLNHFYGRAESAVWESTRAGSALREHVVHFWREFSRRYAEESAIIGYDILNEPAFSQNEYDLWWQDLLPRTINAIRGSDETVWVIVEPNIRERENLVEKIGAILDERCIISFHCYAPLRYTHQGIGIIPTGDVYPGYSDGDEYWDKEALREVVQAAVDVRDATGRRFYAGEFGVQRHLEGREQWLLDAVELWEEYEFDWTVHAMGGWSGWNLTFPADAPVGQRTPWGGVVQAGWQPLLERFRLNNDPMTNRLPAAADDTAGTSPGEPVVLDLLSNDTDADGDALALLAVSEVPHGTASINPDQTVTYTPDPGFRGVEEFYYDVVDGLGGLDVGVVAITVED